MNVTKRDGTTEPIDINKIHRVLTWAAKGLNVSVSDVELKAHMQFCEGIKTSDIHEMLIKSAADLITEQSPDYQYMAARLAMFHLRKKAYGEFNPPMFVDHVVNMVRLGLYDKEFLTAYSMEDLDILGTYLDHDRDLAMTYAAVKQWEGKYLVQDRVTKRIYESPQMAYMLIAMAFFCRYPKDERLTYVIAFYNATSNGKISLPTPIMGGMRTPTRQFSSCVLIDPGDSLDSINASASAVVKYVSQRAGIGINIGRLRALGSPIRGGEAFHTGLIPFIKHFQTAVKSCSQGAIRGGAATLNYPFWHLEVGSLLVLKNNRGTEETRVRHLDYVIQLNKLAYERLIIDDQITLFSPSDVPDLYDAFLSGDADNFERLYTAYEFDKSIRKKHIRASELFTVLMQERAQTGRVYVMNIDHVNSHGAFNPELAPVSMTNLCVEVVLPTKPMTNVAHDEGEIALCTLAAFNLGAIESLDELESLADLIVRALDALLDYQDYPVKAAELARARRALGVGVTNFAYYLAKNGVRYSDGSANNLTHRTFEAIQYYLLKASALLAKEQGFCAAFLDTNYAIGKLPIDTYKRDIDAVHTESLHLDWDELRRLIANYGLRNSTLSALMPCETSSQITNSTNGIEPPRGLVSVKQSKDGTLRQVVPQIGQVEYELLWDIPSNKGYLELVGIMQKFIDQSISANTNYDPRRFPGDKVPMKVLLQDLMYAYKMGVKTLYYHNTRDGSGYGQQDDGCASGACKL